MKIRHQLIPEWYWKKDFTFGSSRSGRADFEGLMELYKKNPDIPEYLENIVGTTFEVESIKDMTEAFETDIHKLIGKTVMNWKG